MDPHASYLSQLELNAQSLFRGPPSIQSKQTFQSGQFHLYGERSAPDPHAHQSKFTPQAASITPAEVFLRVGHPERIELTGISDSDEFEGYICCLKGSTCSLSVIQRSTQLAMTSHAKPSHPLQTTRRALFQFQTRGRLLTTSTKW